jgi:hypothetical protein
MSTLILRGVVCFVSHFFSLNCIYISAALWTAGSQCAGKEWAAVSSCFVCYVLYVRPDLRLAHVHVYVRCSRSRHMAWMAWWLAQE